MNQNVIAGLVGIKVKGGIVTVGVRFSTFLSNLKLTQTQQADGTTKHAGVRNCLNHHYYSINSNILNSMLVGSWGKSTEIRPPRDIDVIFILPDSVYHRFQSSTWNKQSQILQEVKNVLVNRYPNTKLRADGQVVVIEFGSYAVEVVPAFRLTNGQFWICDTNNGGSYKTTDPNAEMIYVRTSNDNTKGNTRDLIRMMKRWQEYCNVPLKSFHIELVAIEFLNLWEYRGNSTTYYDWMVRSFLAYLMTKANGYVFVPGTNERLFLGSAWLSRTETAYNRACNACQYQSENLPYTAGAEWQKIFGSDIPSG